MNSFIKFAAFGIILLASCGLRAQHHMKLAATVDVRDNLMAVSQELTFFNQTADTIGTIVLNDWNNAYSDKNSLLGKRFSDEFVRSFHLAKDKERGNTKDLIFKYGGTEITSWIRPEGQPDLIELTLPEKILPGQKVTIQMSYLSKIPSAQFTKYGYSGNGEINLKNWFLSVARYENHAFIHYSNANLDDIANGLTDYELDLKIPATVTADSDLDQIKKGNESEYNLYTFEGKNRNDFSLFTNPKSEFYSYKNDSVEVITDLKDNKLDEIQKAIIIDRIVNFVRDNVGKFPYAKISVSQTDYERNPFYGLNQLPAFISPFQNDFLYELKFLKTYTNNFLKSSLHLDARKDNWIYDAIQVYVMMKYINEFQPDSKMMGSLSKWKILRGYNIINLEFNEQYSYYYMLMARKNLDQPLGDSKETLIRFNERIASKYRAGLSFKYLDNYLGESILPKTISQFYTENLNQETTRGNFETLLKANAGKNIDWFFNTIIDSRDIIDYKFGKVTDTGDSITFDLKNKTGTTVPIPVYGLKDKQIVWKEWFEKVSADSTFTVPKRTADKIVINYKNEVPEFNLRNNWRSLKVFFGNDRPYKFAFLKDLENPNYNQIIYVPTVTYNLYDGISPGIRLSNKTLLDKPITFDFNPAYSIKAKSLTGSFGFGVNQYLRDKRLFNIRYGVGGSYFHYAPDAAYMKLSPSVTFFMREKDFRDNRKSGLTLKYNIVRKDHSLIVIDSTENYSVFTASYFSTKTEITNHLNYNTNFQASSGFGKVSGELQYRKLFNNNRQVNVRFFAGSFLYKNTDTDYYNFGLDKPNDYLFEYNFFGRSEKSGIFSQQLILAEGGFKSKLKPADANQWLTTMNLSFNVWNWIEVYGDAGFVKNHHYDAKFLYDSGIRLNLVTDYFELYLPVYSSNGWEVGQPNYGEKIRFIFTFSPKSLLNLFTRKWF